MKRSFIRNILCLLSLGTATCLPADVVWVVGRGAPVDAPAVAKFLQSMLNEPVAVVSEDTASLAAWAYGGKSEEARKAALKADTLLITLPPAEPAEYALLGLSALSASRGYMQTKPTVVAVQQPVYKMNGLCNNRLLQETARVSISANCGFAPLPKIRQQVYTDDTFYDGRVPKTAASEAYIAAAGIAVSLKGDTFPIPRLTGVHEAIADRLIASVRKGWGLREDVLYAAAFRSAPAFSVRVGTEFEAVLYDGDFEHAVGTWLERFAAAEGRMLTLRYTTDTQLNTGLPGLFRTAALAVNAPAAACYTRPAFKDDTGREEQQYLDRILELDAGKKGYIPLQLAVAEHMRRYPHLPVYKAGGTLPTDDTAAMFASMLYLQWTGAAVMLPNISQTTAAAISIGLETMLKMRLKRADINAVFCRPVGDNAFAFSLWHRPKDDVRLTVSADSSNGRVSPHRLTFTPKNYWAPQTVTVSGSGTLLWKVPAAELFGQNTGARAYGNKQDAASAPAKP